MPGTYIFKPIEANISQSTSHSSKMNPFCTFVVGGSKIESQVCPKGGIHPRWADSITVPVAEDDSSKIKIVLNDQGKLSNTEIGSCEFDLKEIQMTGHIDKWLPLYENKKCVGEMHVEANFQPDPLSMFYANYVQNEFVAKTNLKHQEPPVVFAEQRQIVEPHTFTKQVESVETRSHIKEIEVMEPIKVIKEVPVTETVHVKKLVEVTKPEVIIKEVEVMEPRLVTKVIQVVEDVPVKRKVEVIEYKTELEEVDTVEPQTIMKSVEVTEYVPVKKEVEVIEPVTIKKEVEYIEPVITTKTVIKEVPQAVIVGEEISRSVGPATILEAKALIIGEAKLMGEEIRQSAVKVESKADGLVVVKDSVVVTEDAEGDVQVKETVQTKKFVTGLAAQVAASRDAEIKGTAQTTKVVSGLAAGNASREAEIIEDTVRTTKFISELVPEGASKDAKKTVKTSKFVVSEHDF